MLKYEPGGHSHPRGSLTLAYLLQPTVHGRAGRHAFEFRAQVILHGFALRCSANGQPVANSFGDITNGKRIGHAEIVPSVQALCKTVPSS